MDITHVSIAKEIAIIVYCSTTEFAVKEKEHFDWLPERSDVALQTR